MDETACAARIGSRPRAASTVTATTYGAEPHSFMPANIGIPAVMSVATARG